MLEKIDEIKKFNLKNATLINDGVSNETYLIDNKYIYRKPSRQSDPFKSRIAEKLVIEGLKNWKNTETVLSFNELTGEKLSAFIEGTYKQGKSINKTDLKKVATLIKEFHALNIKVDNLFYPIKRFDFYRKNSDVRLDIALENHILSQIENLYKKYPLITTHNDLVNNNILFSGDRTYLIDFEFVSKNITIFDLASYLSENNIRNENDIIYFLSCYDKNINIDDVKLMIIYEDLLWFYWANFNYKLSKKEVFKKIADEKKTHLSVFDHLI